MFKKREFNIGNIGNIGNVENKIDVNKIENIKQEEEVKVENLNMGNYTKKSVGPTDKSKSNIFLKGSKVIGDIQFTDDFVLEGSVEGNINSEGKSNIIVKGNCKGTIKTEGGNVKIEGHMSGGDIIAGGDIKITGSFKGGKAEAKGKLSVNGEFSGKLESNEIEIGQDARGKGDIFYNESISITKGAKIEVNINQISSKQSKQQDTKKIPNQIDKEEEPNMDPVQQLIRAH